MNLTLVQLQMVVAVAEAESFSEAARLANMTQPAVSRTIRQVELIVGTRLFERTTRSVKPTAVGEELIRVAHRVLAEYEAGIGRFRAYQAGLRGKLTIAALPSLAAGMLAALVSEFARTRPDVDLSLRAVHSVDLLSAVSNGTADLAVTNDPGPVDGLQSRPLFADEMVVLCSPDHAFAVAEHVRWATLSEQTFIALEPGTSVRSLTDQGFAACGQSPQRVVTTDAIGSAAALVAERLGVTAAPRSVLSLTSPHALVTVPLVEPEIVRRLAVVTRTEPALGPAAVQFVESLVSTLAE